MSLPNEEDSRAVVMEETFYKRFRELTDKNPRAGALTAYIIEHMNSNGECSIGKNDIAKHLDCSIPTLSRTIKILRDNYNDIVKIKKQGQTNKYFINGCWLLCKKPPRQSGGSKIN